MADRGRLCFGLALGTKWNALYVLAAFALLVAGLGRRRPPARRAGDRATRADLRDGIPAFVSLVRAGRGRLRGHLGRAGSPPAAGTTGLGRHSTRTRGRPGSSGAPLASLLHYQRDIWNFHTGDFINHAQHSYRANPIGWLVVARPIGIDAVNDIRPAPTAAPAPTTASG